MKKINVKKIQWVTQQLHHRRYFVLLQIVLLLALTGFFTPSACAYVRHEYVVVAWDEEFAAGGPTLFKYLWGDIILHLTPPEYSEWQWGRALYHFHNYFGTDVQVEVIGTVTFDSEDAGSTAYTLLEAIDELDWETKRAEGWYFNGKRATILMVWTLQNNDNMGGTCYQDKNAFIVKCQQPWMDDNAVLHELTHIWENFGFGLMDTWHGHCIMSYSLEFYWVYSEPLQPENGHYDLSLWSYITVAYTAYEYCVDCENMVRAQLHGGDPVPREKM